MSPRFRTEKSPLALAFLGKINMAPFTRWWSAWSGSDGCELKVQSDGLVTAEMQLSVIITEATVTATWRLYLLITPSNCGSDIFHLLPSCGL